MDKKQPEGRIKILMLGESGVGKTSILLRFTDNQFTNDFTTTLGVEYKQRTLKIKNKNVMVQIWDTAGQERFRTITPVYYRSVHGVVLTYDITDKESLESINYWMENLAETSDINNLQIVLVGNKCDLKDKRQVSLEDGQEIARKYNIPFFETSAKTSDNVLEIFIGLSERILDQQALQEPIKVNNGDAQSQYSKLDQTQKNPKKGGCCN